VPFDWRFTRTDLDRLLRRLDEHERLAHVAEPPRHNLPCRRIQADSRSDQSLPATSTVR
jgi:hypothetical protein